MKLLWGRAASRCAICKSRLTEDKSVATQAFPLGEQAHIVAEEPGGPRGNSVLTAEERNNYHNLILVCPTHHVVIDKNFEDYPIERLHMLKAAHELWVERTLAEKTDIQRAAEDQILADVVDAAVSMCRLEEWETWTSWAMSSDPRWPVELCDSVHEFRLKVMRVLWPPSANELRAAALHLSITLERARAAFMEISRPDADMYVTDRYYREAPNEELYYEKVDEFNAHLRCSHQNIVEATKAANWLSTVVRQVLNPMFLTLHGRFTVTEGPLADPPLSWRTTAAEYDAEEMQQLIAKYTAG